MMWVRPFAAMVLAVALTACSTEATPKPPAVSSPFADCAALTAASPAVGRAELPDLELACFTGGRAVRLVDLPRPAVINMWASWCGPCRTELPVIQDLAERTEGRLTVLAVDSGDRRDAAASFAVDHAITMPTLFDPEKKLAGELGQASLPTTIFIDATGRRYVHRLPLDAAELARQAREHTGVTVTQ